MLTVFSFLQYVGFPYVVAHDARYWKGDDWEFAHWQDLSISPWLMVKKGRRGRSSRSSTQMKSIQIGEVSCGSILCSVSLSACQVRQAVVDQGPSHYGYEARDLVAEARKTTGYYAVNRLYYHRSLCLFAMLWVAYRRRGRAITR